MRSEILDDDNVEVQMAPLIDCVFLLLIFFLVASQLKKIEKELPITPPEAVYSQAAQRDDTTLIIGVDKTGRPYLQGDPVPYGVLLSQLNDVARDTPQRKVRIAADRDARFEDVVQVLAALEVRALRNVTVHVGDPKN